jgi:catechol 2,3-dioxygenase-like lactoylglutathione lyase family enzyme
MPLNHITLAVADVEESAGFYVRPGLTQIVDSYPDYARFLLRMAIRHSRSTGAERGCSIQASASTSRWTTSTEPWESSRKRGSTSSAS